MPDRVDSTNGIAPTEGDDAPGSRIAASILSLFGLISFLLLYATFWAGAYTWAQSAVVVIVALLIFVGINGSAWAGWGVRHASRSRVVPVSRPPIPSSSGPDH